jgi:LPXTG-site transpeptidase (sortase) family protein
MDWAARVADSLSAVARAAREHPLLAGAVSASVLIAVAVVLLFAGSGGDDPAGAPGTDLELALDPSPPPAPVAPPKPSAPQPAPTPAAAPPPSVKIPSIGVAATMIPLGLTAEGRLEVPQDYGVPGWWSGGPEPGDRGAAVVVGHVDSKAGPAIFYRLDELEAGDEVVMTNSAGAKTRFLVEGTEEVRKDDFPTRRVYEKTPEPTLRLVTCSGGFNEATGHYVNNLIVYASADPVR